MTQTKDEKIRLIYTYVKENMAWNNKHELFVDLEDSDIKKIYSKTGAKVDLKNLGDILESGAGSSSEINFVLLHLLVKAGIKADPVLVNTVSNYPVDKNIPEVEQFITVVAGIEINDGYLFLDAANPESSFESMAKEYLNTKKFRVSKTNYGWVK